MVNVGGRSKGCCSCRRRRIKCDESRPICGQCARHSLECTWNRDITFVQATIVKSRRTEKQKQVATRMDLGKNDAAVRLLPSLQQRNETELYICYFKAQLRLQGSVAVAMEQLHFDELIPPDPASRQLFPQALVSFATIFFGTRHRQSQITTHGYFMLGIAMKQLNQKLSEPRCYVHDEVIITVITFALLESWVPSGPQNYLTHMSGVQKLLELRGPDPKSIGFYRGARHMILFASLRMRKPSILARAEWKAAFRINCSDEQLQEQDLYDILADCSVLIAERDERLGREMGSVDNTNRCSEIERKALALLTQLQYWKKLWNNQRTSLYSEIPAPENHSPPFLTIFDFSNDSIAPTLLFYNLVIIHVLQVLASLDLENKEAYTVAEWSAALDICRCIPYCLRREPHLDFRVVHLAVVTACTTIRGKDTAEGRWLLSTLNNKSREVFAKGLWSE